MMSKSVDEPAQSSALLKVLALATLCILTRLLLLVSWARPKGRKRTPGRDTCSLAIFLGSGGHTSEMMQLVCALPTNRYHSRTYIVSKGDRFSMDKALAYEKSITDPKRTFRFVRLPRARSVHQRWLTTPLSVVDAFAVSVYHLVLCPLLLDRKNARIPDAILMNGPGTCVPIVAAVYLLRVFGLASPRLIYVESFARVSSLSLTAKIVRPLVDRFVVQWPQALVRGTDYRGCLV